MPRRVNFRLAVNRTERASLIAPITGQGTNRQSGCAGRPNLFDLKRCEDPGQNSTSLTRSMIRPQLVNRNVCTLRRQRGSIVSKPHLIITLDYSELNTVIL